MEKKAYQAPVIEVIAFQTEHLLSASNTVNSIGGNGNLKMGGSGSTPNRSRRRRDVWDSGWE